MNFETTSTHAAPSNYGSFCEEERKGCRNDYIKPFPTFSFEKNVKLERKKKLETTPLGRKRSEIFRLNLQNPYLNSI